MKSLEALIEKALELKEKGLSEKEIGDELHLSLNTVTWLLVKGLRGGAPPPDVKIGWRSIGVYANRIGFVSATMSDIILEEMEKTGEDFDSVCGIAINGIPYATFVSEELGKELVIYRPSEARHRGGGLFSSNYAGVEEKKIVIVDDILSSGDTIKGAIADITESGGSALLAVVMVNKTEHDDIDGVRLRAMVRARAIA
ncbi:MAG: orotate phosphoribosyltransferase-like protein [Methanomassiliicoccales archaeon]|nr:MAG: orotate phosphoribosyltransferase-like protein [Methanomassiliicoccales archaeon]